MAMACRIVDIPFRATFVENIHDYVTDDDEQPDSTSITESDDDRPVYFACNPVFKSTNFKETYRLALFHIVAQAFHDFYHHHQLKVSAIMPASIDARNRDYLIASDEFLSWFTQYPQYRKTGDKHHTLALNTIYTDFKHSDLYNNMTKAAKRKTRKIVSPKSCKQTFI